MAIDVSVELVIKRKLADVANYMFDPSHDAEWTTGVVASKPLGKGHLKPGMRVRRTVEFVGRRMDYEYKVVAADESFVEMVVEKPFAMNVRYELEQEPKGTVTRIHAKGEPGGFIRVPGPLLKGILKRNLKADLKALQAHLEKTSAKRKK